MNNALPLALTRSLSIQTFPFRPLRDFPPEPARGGNLFSRLLSNLWEAARKPFGARSPEKLRADAWAMAEAVPVSETEDGAGASSGPSASAAEDWQWVQRFQAGHEDGFNRLVLKHKDAMVTLCLRMLGQREDAEDCAQEAFVRCYRGLRDFRGEARFSTWLYRIAFNACLNRKASAAHRRRSEEVAGDWVDALPASEGESPEALVNRKRQVQRIQAALAQVPEEFRQALILRDIEGRDYGEVAEVLQVPLGTVRSRLNRGRQRLRELLEGAP